MVREVFEYIDESGEHLRDPYLNVDIFHGEGYDLVVVARHFIRDKITPFASYVIAHTRQNRDLILDCSSLADADSSCPAEIIRIRQKRGNAHLALCGLRDNVRRVIDIAAARKDLWKKVGVEFFESVADALRKYGHDYETCSHQ